MEFLVKAVGAFVVVGLLVVVFAFLGAIFTQWGYNNSVAEMYGLKEITFMQAFWLNFLCGLLFKSSSSSSK